MTQPKTRSTSGPSRTLALRCVPPITNDAVAIGPTFRELVGSSEQCRTSEPTDRNEHERTPGPSAGPAAHYSPIDCVLTKDLPAVLDDLDGR